MTFAESGLDGRNAPLLAPPKAPSPKLKAKRWALSKHKLLALVGGLGLFIFGLSGMLHIVLVTWGPQQAVLMPPTAPISLSGAAPIHETLAKAGIAKAAAVKVVASQDRALLQVTQDPMAPRRYFDLRSGGEVTGQDEAQAVFLARHYLQSDAPIRSVDFLTSFSADYPWVNRLLPVYRVDFEGPGDPSIYVYTETNASAGVTNTFKRAVQTGFRTFHSWEWIPDDAEWARVAIIAVFVGALLALVITGILMLVTIRRKIKARGSRHVHRLSGYVLALPLLMFTTSGLFHLITFAGPPPGPMLSLSQELDLREARFPLHAQWQAVSEGLTINAVSIVAAPDGGFLYRLGLDHGKGPMAMEAGAMRQARFEGTLTTGPALYLNAQTGARWQGGDKAMALSLGEHFMGGKAALKGITHVTRYGPLYDFRNKRLPVWQLDYGPPLSKTIWVDTAIGALVDVLDHSALPERWSFAFIHKWGFLRPLGSHGQNAIIATFVLASVGLMGGLGIRQYLKGRRKR